jgi:hypothetical protein
VTTDLWLKHLYTGLRTSPSQAHTGLYLTWPFTTRIRLGFHLTVARQFWRCSWHPVSTYFNLPSFVFQFSGCELSSSFCYFCIYFVSGCVTNSFYLWSLFFFLRWFCLSYFSSGFHFILFFTQIQSSIFYFTYESCQHFTPLLIPTFLWDLAPHNFFPHKNISSLLKNISSLFLFQLFLFDSQFKSFPFVPTFFSVVGRVWTVSVWGWGTDLSRMRGVRTPPVGGGVRTIL